MSGRAGGRLASSEVYLLVNLFFFKVICYLYSSVENPVLLFLHLEALAEESQSLHMVREAQLYIQSHRSQNRGFTRGVHLILSLGFCRARY